jgi:tight adherence protein B
VATLVMAHRVGGRELGQVLRTLGGFLREDFAVRKEIEARQSWTLVAARVAAAAPWFVLVLVASRPQGAAAYDSLGGLVVLVGGAVATVVGYRLMVALGRLPEEPRVLLAAPVEASGAR